MPRRLKIVDAGNRPIADFEITDTPFDPPESFDCKIDNPQKRDVTCKIKGNQIQQEEQYPPNPMV